MAKKLSMMNCLLAVVVVLALVYFFRPQTFSFLKQGFSSSTDVDDFEPDGEGFNGCPEGQKDDGEGNCVPEGFNGCPEGQKDDGEGNCVPEGFDGCPEGQRTDSDGNCVPEGFSDSMGFLP